MRDFDNENEEDLQEDEIFGKSKKSAVLEIDEEGADEVIHAIDEDFETSDNLSDDEESGNGPTLYEVESEDDLRLQF